MTVQTQTPVDSPPAGTLLSLLTARWCAPAASQSLRVAAVLFVSALTAAAAQVSLPLPFTPVPLSVQPMVVLLGAAALGARAGAASQALYLLAGIAGLPAFAASPLLPAGAARLIGPTGGYLMAYPLAAFVTGWLAERGFDRRYLTTVLAMLAGLTVVFGGGVTWLAVTINPLAPAQAAGAALGQGLYPFVVVDLFKVLVAAAALPAAWRLLK